MQASQWKACQHHITRRTCGMEYKVANIFGKHNLPYVFNSLSLGASVRSNSSGYTVQALLSFPCVDAKTCATRFHRPCSTAPHHRAAESADIKLFLHFHTSKAPFLCRKFHYVFLNIFTQYFYVCVSKLSLARIKNVLLPKKKSGHEEVRGNSTWNPRAKPCHPYPPWGHMAHKTFW